MSAAMGLLTFQPFAIPAEHMRRMPIRRQMSGFSAGSEFCYWRLVDATTQGGATELKSSRRSPHGGGYSEDSGAIWRYQANCSLVASRRPARDQ